MYRSFGKRIFDLIIVVPSIILASPLFILLVILVRVFIGSPVFFTQLRPGYKGKPFTIIKFRTMTNARDRDGKLLPDAHRLVPFGMFLRKTRLDELPEVINVLKGEMSLVGPRPLLMEYLTNYSKEQARRHDVLPGVTGLAQISGGQAMRFSERMKIDLYYVDHLSVWMDLQILFLTIAKLFISRISDNPGTDISEIDDIGLHPDSTVRRHLAGKK